MDRDVTSQSALICPPATEGVHPPHLLPLQQSLPPLNSVTEYLGLGCQSRPRGASPQTDLDKEHILYSLVI